MTRLVATLALLSALAPATVLACDVQREASDVSRLYAEKAALLPDTAAAAIGAALATAGKLHEIGKNADACEHFAVVRARLLAAPAGQPEHARSR